MHPFARPLSRRRFLSVTGLAGAGLATMALTGCGDDDDDDEPVPTATSAPSGPERKALVAGWYKGKEVKYYDFGPSTPLAAGGAVATAPIYVFITGMNADGTPAFVEGQHNIVEVTPGDDGYSDLWEVFLVTVPEDYDPDSIKSKSELDAAGYPMMAPGLHVNCPIVPQGTTFEGGESLVQGWKDGEPVFYPDFGENPTSAVPIWVLITGMNPDGSPKFVQGQGNIIDLVPGDAGYSAFWLVNMVTVPEDYVANTAKSAEEIRAAGYDVMPTEMLVNCPVTVVA